MSIHSLSSSFSSASSSTEPLITSSIEQKVEACFASGVFNLEKAMQDLRSLRNTRNYIQVNNNELTDYDKYLETLASKLEIFDYNDLIFALEQMQSLSPTRISPLLSKIFKEISTNLNDHLQINSADKKFAAISLLKKYNTEKLYTQVPMIFRVGVMKFFLKHIDAMEDDPDSYSVEGLIEELVDRSQNNFQFEITEDLIPFDLQDESKCEDISSPHSPNLSVFDDIDFSIFNKD